ncbi:hypothetical protein CC86DRAFT_438247 [Ophiobolus disseminans]|uniref:SRR1-like domain-containing protein n=1 Tax=Ophiobolus disseminans TaxID=1469910 RepID=A0A6A7A678_9PLEO|nr:hypothetical protein CC86DRAFT_438247 [Ophiobolus disseminans]
MSSSSEDENWGIKRALSTPTWTSGQVAALRRLFGHHFYTAEYMQHLVECEEALNKEPFEATIRTFDVKAWSTRDPKKCCDKEGRVAAMKEIRRGWAEDLPFHAKMETYIEKFAKRMVEVKSITCFGLSKLRIDPDLVGLHAAQNYLQYVAALEVRDMIAEVQEIPKESIPIYVQDPAYCSNCKKIIEEELGFTVVPGNSDFLKVNGNTFIVSKAPAAPFYMGACKAEMLMEMRKSPGPDSDQEEADTEAKVPYDDWLVGMGSVFGEVGWYFKEKRFG